MKTLFKTALLTAMFVVAMTATALAGDGGQGWYGEHTDKVVTFFGLGLVILFPLIALIGTLIQNHYEKRAEERKQTIFKK